MTQPFISSGYYGSITDNTLVGGWPQTTGIGQCVTLDANIALGYCDLMTTGSNQCAVGTSSLGQCDCKGRDFITDHGSLNALIQENIELKAKLETLTDLVEALSKKLDEFTDVMYEPGGPMMLRAQSNYEKLSADMVEAKKKADFPPVEPKK
jgi:hypothetical protein